MILAVTTATLRELVLHAFDNLERRHARSIFDLHEVVQEVLSLAPEAKEVSVRTQIVSVMCADAPVHHANHTDDLERVGRGRYRRTASSLLATPAASATAPAAKVAELMSWPWEGAVQAVAVRHLQRDGWEIRRTADTATGEQGTDIVAVRGNETLLVEVKGFPSNLYQRGVRAGERKPTSPNTQARHWYAGAVLSALLARHDHPAATIRIALPDVGTYRKLAARTQASLGKVGVDVWLLEDDIA